MDVIHTLIAQDLPSFKHFIRTHFHDRHILLDDSYFDWQYKKNPFNTFPEYSVKIIKHKDEILGYCGVIPIELQVGTTTMSAGVFANLLVDEKIRGFGFGTLLVKAITEEFPISFVNGYSEKLKKVCQRLPGWIEMGNLHRMIGVLNVGKTRILSDQDRDLQTVSISKKRDSQLKKIKRFGNEIEEFWSTVQERYSITTNRSTLYLNWRYSSHPLLSYDIFEYLVDSKVVAYAVIRIEKFIYNTQEFTVARIIDCMSHQTAEVDLFDALINYYMQKKIDFIDYFYSGSTHTNALRDLGFVDSDTDLHSSIPLLFNPVDRGRSGINWVVCSTTESAHSMNFSDENSWYITKGDGDQDRPNIL